MPTFLTTDFPGQNYRSIKPFKPWSAGKPVATSSDAGHTTKTHGTASVHTLLYEADH